jgi:hypothetical protein
MVKKIVGTGVLLVLALALQAGVKMYTLKSPDGKVKLEVTAGQGIAYSLFYDGRLLLKPSRIALHTDLPEADHWENIRQASNAENCRNQRRPRNNTSGFKGVSLHRLTGKYQSYIRKDGRRIHLGLFPSALLAHRAYKAASKKLFGEFARPG